MIEKQNQEQQANFGNKHKKTHRKHLKQECSKFLVT
jgi:hypothetical protein